MSMLRPSQLGQWLRRSPLRPGSVAALFDRQEPVLLFRRIVQECFPADVAERILNASAPGRDRESARLGAFVTAFEQVYFPLEEPVEYAQLCYGIPFRRYGWSCDDRHEIDGLCPGTLLLMLLCACPYDSGRVALLDAAGCYLSPETLAQVPEDGIEPAELHTRLNGTPFAALVTFCDWLWSATGTAFLDASWDDELENAEWDSATVAALASEWQVARALLEQIDALSTWLEADPQDHFTRLLLAALGRDPHFAYQRVRRFYHGEFTLGGISPIITGT